MRGILRFPKQQLADILKQQDALRRNAKKKTKRMLEARRKVVVKQLCGKCILLQGVRNANGDAYIKYYPKQQNDDDNLKSLTSRARHQLLDGGKPKVAKDDVVEVDVEVDEVPPRGRSRTRTKRFNDEYFTPPVGLRHDTVQTNKKLHVGDSTSSIVPNDELEDWLRHNGLDARVAGSADGGMSISLNGKPSLTTTKYVWIHGKKYSTYHIKCAVNWCYGGSHNN